MKFTAYYYEIATSMKTEEAENGLEPFSAYDTKWHPLTEWMSENAPSFWMYMMPTCAEVDPTTMGPNTL